jgi:large subunit ribosomal protein L29
MKASEIRDLGAEELEHRIAELEEELFRSRLQNATGQMENPLRIQHLRRDIARCKTIQREKAVQAEGAR